MCGIIGLVSDSAIVNRSWIAAGRDAMRHRGPDDAGEWWSLDGRVGFGHRRLAIIDLSIGGHQPMEDALRELCIVFNGEIYNYRDIKTELEAKGYAFRSRSDTEVILTAYREWGADCLSRLDGQFALAIYDSRVGRVLLARDRAGEKPLFYAVTNGGMRFASELKGLLADVSWPRQIDPDALDCYLAMGFVPGDRCLLQGAHKLPAAHALLFDVRRGTSQTWRYWRLPDAVPSVSSADEPALLDELEELLADAVKQQLLASDVPVGVLLSGGVDSSIITALAARAASQIKTFTIRFPGHRRFDETEHARLIARHFGTDHVELEAGPSTVDLMPLLARQFDEPIVDSSMIPTFLVSRLVREHCTVALGGDGGDELFGGYQHHDRLLWADARFGGLPIGLRRIVANAAAAIMPVGFKGRNWIQGMATDLRHGLPLIACYFDVHSRRELLGKSGMSVAETIFGDRVPNSPDLLQRVTRMDFENFLAEDILVKVDRASMLNSLEVRAPLLDRRVIEFAFGRVPSSLKATPSSRKMLLKRLAGRLLPAEFDQQRKQGFSIPLASWLRGGPWLEYFREVLLGSSGGFFDRRAVESLLKGHAHGRANSERLFALVLFELWRREYGL